MIEGLIIIGAATALFAWLVIKLVAANAEDVADHEGALEADLTDYVKTLNEPAPKSPVQAALNAHFAGQQEKAWQQYRDMHKKVRETK